jgi:hypothetical protein
VLRLAEEDALSQERSVAGWAKPNGPNIDPPLVVFTVRILVEELRRRLSHHPGLERRYLAGDDEVERESLVFACATVGVEPRAYRLALEVDGTLSQLHDQAVTEAICGTTDPGPSDFISRESPSGSEKNEHFNDWMQRGNSP